MVGKDHRDLKGLQVLAHRDPQGVGAQGPPGIGSQGPQGPQGVGAQGPQGIGSQGSQGPQGVGTQGPQGPQGAPGQFNPPSITQTVYVQKGGSDLTGNGSFGNPYLTVRKGVSSITDSSSSKPYTVIIGPGDYIETGSITIPTFVAVVGQQSPIIIPGGAFDLFLFSSSCTLSTIIISNVTPTHYGLRISDAGTGIAINNIIFMSTPKPIYIDTLTRPSTVAISGILLTSATTDCVTVTDNNSGFLVSVNLEGLRVNNRHSDNFVKVSGPNSAVSVQNSTILGDGTGNCVTILNSARVIINSSTILNFTNGLITGDTIPTPQISGSSILFRNNTFDLAITNPTTTGHYDGVVSYSGTDIHSQSPFFITGRDPRIITVATSDGDFGSIAAAIGVINPYVTINTTNGSFTITSAGAFRAAYSGAVNHRSRHPTREHGYICRYQHDDVESPGCQYGNRNGAYYSSYDPDIIHSCGGPRLLCRTTDSH